MFSRRKKQLTLLNMCKSCNSVLTSDFKLPLLLLCFLFLQPLCTQCNVPYQYQISNYVNLISSYDYEDTYSTVDLIPLEDASQIMYVSIGMSFFAINDFDEVSGSIEIVGALDMRWTDEMPKINSIVFSILDPSEDFFLVPPDMIWTPNLVLTNAVGETGKVGSDQFMALFNMTTNGVRWRPRVIMTASCTPDVTFYPFDKQSCEFTFSPWGFRSDEITLISTSDTWDMSEYSESGEWDVLDTSSETAIRNYQSYVIYKIDLLRKPLYASFNILLPVMILCGLNSVVFLLPAESGERVGFSITLFLSFMVFLNTVMDFMPRSSSPVSYLCFYLVLMMCNSAGMTLVTVLMLRVYHKPEKSKVPKKLSWCVNFINCGCAKLRCCVLMCRCLKDNVCFCNPNSDTDTSGEDSKTCCKRICQRHRKQNRKNTQIQLFQEDTKSVSANEDVHLKKWKLLPCFRPQSDIKEEPEPEGGNRKRETNKQTYQTKSNSDKISEGKGKETHKANKERKALKENAIEGDKKKDGLNKLFNTNNEQIIRPVEHQTMENTTQNTCDLAGIFKCIIRRQGLEDENLAQNEAQEKRADVKDVNCGNNQRRKFRSDVLELKSTGEKSDLEKVVRNQSDKATNGTQSKVHTHLDTNVFTTDVNNDQSPERMADENMIPDKQTADENATRVTEKEGNKTGKNYFAEPSPTKTIDSVVKPEVKTLEGRVHKVKPDTTFLEFLLESEFGDSGVGSTLISEKDTAEIDSLDIFKQYRDSSSEESDGDTISMFSERPLSGKKSRGKKSDSELPYVSTEGFLKPQAKVHLETDHKEHGTTDGNNKDRNVTLATKELQDISNDQSTELTKGVYGLADQTKPPAIDKGITSDLKDVPSITYNDDTESLAMFRQYQDSTSEESDGETVSIFSKGSKAESMKSKVQPRKDLERAKCQTKLYQNIAKGISSSCEKIIELHASKSDQSFTSNDTIESDVRNEAGDIKDGRLTPAIKVSKKSKIVPIIIPKEFVKRGKTENNLKNEKSEHGNDIKSVTVSVKKREPLSAKTKLEVLPQNKSSTNKKLQFSPDTIESSGVDNTVKKIDKEMVRRYSVPYLRNPTEMQRRHSVAYTTRPTFEINFDEDDGLDPDVEWADVGRVLDFFSFLAFLALQIFLTVVFFVPIATSTTGSEES